MSINEKIQAALSSFENPVAHGVYQGEEERYYVFDYTSEGAGFGDDAPACEMCSITLSYRCPLADDSALRIAQTKQALFSAGFTWPGASTSADAAGRQILFECQIPEKIEPVNTSE